jgi:hypothetical protein
MPTLLRAFTRVREAHLGATLRMIGRAHPPELDDRLRQMAAELGVAGAVALEPSADRAGVAAAMRRADLFVHPSRAETFGMVAAEALASGLPVVGTRSGGIEGILGSDPERFGALVPVDGARALARAIGDALTRRGDFDAAALRRHAEERFAPAVIAGQLLDLYREVLAGGEVGPLAGRTVPVPSVAARPPALVVGLNRTRAARLLAALPKDLRGRLALVTVEATDGAALPVGLGPTVEVDLGSGQREILAAARAARPVGSSAVARALRAVLHTRLRRRARWAGAHPAEMRLLTASRAVRSALRATRRDARLNRWSRRFRAAIEPPDVVCLDGYDVLAVEPLLKSGEVRLCPGTARWLADQAQSRASASTTAT